jgi:hypothetical protein
MSNSVGPRVPALGLARLILCLAALWAASLITPRSAYADDNEQRVYATPQAAVDALIAAVKAGNPGSAISPVLGPDADKVISSGDKVADDNALKRFISAYDRMHRLAYDSDGQVILYVGADDWPLPIPLVKKGTGWIFDTAAGEQELVYRRVGANELYTIDVLENLVEAQNDYAERMRGQTGVAQYAQRILSDQGKHDGLYWPTAAGEPESPIGPLIAKAVSEGYQKGQQGQPVPFHGYIYSVLKAQGESATGGAMSYVRNRRMTRGFAFMAYPAEYRASWVMTFIVNREGVVMSKDLGPDTAKLAPQISRYNPDHTWQQAEPSGPEPQQVPPEETSPAAAPGQTLGAAPANVLAGGTSWKGAKSNDVRSAARGAASGLDSRCRS